MHQLRSVDIINVLCLILEWDDPWETQGTKAFLIERILKTKKYFSIHCNFKRLRNLVVMAKESRMVHSA